MHGCDMMMCVVLFLLLISSSFCQTTPNSLDPGDSAFRLNPDKSYWFGYKNNDEASLSQTQVGTADNNVQGVYQFNHPETGGSRTEYTAGERGFRARGTNIHRQMDLSQAKIPYNPPVNPDSPAYNPTYDGYHDPNENPSYKFNVRTPTFVKDEVAGPQGQVQGSYTYTDDIGEVHKVDYEAGAGKGFRVKNPIPDNTQTGFFYGGPGIPPRGKTSVQQNDDGSYTFVAQGPNLRRAEKRDNQGRVAGSYSYIDEKGSQKTVSYIAGPETGYQIVSKVPTEFIPLFQPGYFSAVTPILPFPTNFPKFPTSTFSSDTPTFTKFPDIKNKFPQTTFAPLFPTSTTTISPPIISSFPTSQKPSIDQFENDIFGSIQPTESPFSTPSSSSIGSFGGSSGGSNDGSFGGSNEGSFGGSNGGSFGGSNGGLFNNKNNNNNPNKNNNNNFNNPNSLFSSNGGGFNGGSKPDPSFLNPQSTFFNPSNNFGSTQNQNSNSQANPFPNPNNDPNTFLTAPNLNTVPNNIPVISFPVENSNKQPGDFSNICKVCRSLRDKSDQEYFNSRPYRPPYNTYNNQDEGNGFNRFPHGAAVRAHVQSIDLYPFGPRVPEPGVAIDSIERIDRSSPEILEGEVLFTTPSTNLGASLHNARQNFIENSRKNLNNQARSDKLTSKNQSEVVNKNTSRREETNKFSRDNSAKNAISSNQKMSSENPESYFKDLNDFSNQIQSSNNSATNPFLLLNTGEQKNGKVMASQRNKKQNQENSNKVFQDSALIQPQLFGKSQENANIETFDINNNDQNKNFYNNGAIHTAENCDNPQNHHLQAIGAKYQSSKPVGPNLLELLQKEVRSRPIHVPNLPDEQSDTFNNLSSSPYQQNQSTGPVDNSSEISKERKTPARDRMRRRYSRFSNKENVQGRRKTKSNANKVTE